MTNPFKRLANLLAGNGSTGASSPASACGLGLDGLPPGLAQLPTGTPVALAWQDRAADRLWAHALVQDLLQHGPVMLLAQDEQHADTLLEHPALELARQQGKLLVWLMTAELLQGRQLDSRNDRVQELDALQSVGLTPSHALLVLANASTHLGSSVASAQRWGRRVARWSKSRTRPVLFAFTGWQEAGEVLNPLLALAESFQNVALLGSEALRPVLFLERWNSADNAGPLYAVRLGLKEDTERQRLHYDGSQMRGPRQQLVEAPDEYQVIATEAALAGQRGVPASWTVLKPDADVVHASEDAVASTLLLDAGSGSQLEALLQQVYQLRQQHGRALKIVVRETQDKLRATVEQALLHLGANRVVYREVGFARLQHLLEELHDESFARDLQPDYASARAAFSPEPLRGYLPADAFCKAVETMLERTELSGLHHSFLRLSMQPQVAHLDAVAACLPMRDGDLVTTDQNALYVFLFACSETDIAPALDRLFTTRPDLLFAEQILFGTEEATQAALLHLREAARLGLPDYSAYRSKGTPHADPSVGLYVAGSGAVSAAALPAEEVGLSHASPSQPAALPAAVRTYATHTTDGIKQPTLCIAFVSPLGGTGQTSVAANLASLWGADGYPVLAVDLCAQNSLGLHLGQTDVPFLPFKQTDDLLPAQSPNWLATQLQSAALQDHSLVLLDAPAWPHPQSQQALHSADLVVVCLDTSPRAPHMAEQVQALMQQARPGTPLAVLATSFNPRRESQRLALQVLQGQWPDAISPYVLHDDENMAAALTANQCVTRFSPTAQASHDLHGIARWLLAHCPQAKDAA